MPDYVNITGDSIELPGDGEHELVIVEPGGTVTADTNPASALFADPDDPDAPKPYEPVDEEPEPPPAPPPEPVPVAQPETEVTGADS